MAKDINAQINVDSKKAEVSLDNLVGKVKRLRTEIALSIKSLKEITTTIKKLTDNSDKYTVSMRLLGTVLGDNTEKATKFINKLADMSGLNETDLANAVSKFTQLGESLELDSNNAEKFAENLTILSTKLSMLYGVDPTVMTKNVQKAIQGTQTTLKTTTGIYATESNMQAVLMEKGINREISSLNDAETAILRYAAILRQVTNDQKVYGDAVNSLAWQKQMLSAQVKRLSTAIGQLLTPVVTKLVTILNALLMVLTEIVKFIGKLFNITIDTAKATSDVSDSYEDVAKNIDKAAKTAKKSLRSFDMLNNITTPNETQKSGALGIDSSILGLLDETNQNFLDIENNATKIRDRILEWLGFTRDENGELKWTGKQLAENIFGTIKNIIQWIKDNPLKALGIAAGIATVIWLIKKLKGLGVGKALSKLAGAVKAISVGIAGFAILGGVAMVIQEIIALIKVFNESGMSLEEVLKLIGGLLLEIAAAIGIIALALSALGWDDILAGIVVLGGLIIILQEITGLFKTLAENGIGAGEAFGYMAGILGSLLVFLAALVAISKVLSKDPLALVGLAAITAVLIGLLYVIRETLPDILGACGDFIEQIAPYIIELVETIGEKIKDIISLLGEVLPPIVQEIGKIIDKVFEGIAKVIEKAGNVIIKIIDRVEKFLKELPNTLTTFVESVLESIQKIINFIIRAVNYLINEIVIAGINKLIDALNKVLGLVGASISHVPNWQLPAFEGYKEGGFPEDGFFYANHNELVGEFSNGKTAVANNDQIVKGIQEGVFSGMMSALQNTDFGGDVVIEASGDTEGILDFITFKQRQKERQFN